MLKAQRGRDYTLLGPYLIYTDKEENLDVHNFEGQRLGVLKTLDGVKDGNDVEKKLITIEELREAEEKEAAKDAKKDAKGGSK